MCGVGVGGWGGRENATGGVTKHPPMVFAPYKKTTNPIFNKMVWLEGVPTGASIYIYVYEVIEDAGGQGVKASNETARFCHGKCRMKPWANVSTLEAVASNITPTKKIIRLLGAKLGINIHIHLRRYHHNLFAIITPTSSIAIPSYSLRSTTSSGRRLASGSTWSRRHRWRATAAP